MLYTPNSTNYSTNYGERTVILPPATDHALVFHFDKKNKKFDNGFYAPALTDGRGSNEMIGSFLGELEDIFKQKFKWLRRLKFYLFGCFIVNFFMLTLYSLAIITDTDSDYYDYSDSSDSEYDNSASHRQRNLRHRTQKSQYDADEEFDVIFLCWFFMLLSAMIWSVIIAACDKYCHRKAREGVKAAIEKNYQLFASYGLRWNLPLAFPHYIELWKDYKGQNYVQPAVQVNFAPINQLPIQPQIHNTQYGQTQKYPTFNNQSQNDYFVFQDSVPNQPLITNKN